MSGIIGYIGSQNAIPLLLGGLKRLEYRGYDSAGLALICEGKLFVKKCGGKIKILEKTLQHENIYSDIGIGHTRWATHGEPSELNAHPLVCGEFAIVHNGIIENYIDLQRSLSRAGYKLQTKVDSEVIACLLNKHFRGDLSEALMAALDEVQGSYAVACLSSWAPDTIVAARKGPPLSIGLGRGEFFLASDITPLVSFTRDFIFLEDGEFARLTKSGVTILDRGSHFVSKDIKRVAWNPVLAEKRGYSHFMLKEIYEQPRAVAETIRGRVEANAEGVSFDELKIGAREIAAFKKVSLFGCGSSYHAALIGKYLFESIGSIPAEVDFGSELRYRKPFIDDSTVTIAISQSGETADTLAALREAKGCGAKTISICSSPYSSIALESHDIILTHTGPEVSVPATKTFTATLAVLYLLAIHFGLARGGISGQKAKELLKSLTEVPLKLERALKLDDGLRRISKEYSKCQHFFYLGRGINYPLALEGAMKLKETSYIHAEGLPSGEMKQGSIALIEAGTPVVALIPQGMLYDKTLANIEEALSRGADVIAFTTEKDDIVRGKSKHTFFVPQAGEYLAPMVLLPPLQLLAYHIALRRGCEIDQPRNLAKSVTVE